MADEYHRDNVNNDRTAKAIAVVALILALIAMGLAIRADNRAGDAERKADSSLQQAQ